MRNFLFEEISEGFRFLIGAEDYADALTILEDLWSDGVVEDIDDVVFIDELSDIEAEMSGLDKYKY